MRGILLLPGVHGRRGRVEAHPAPGTRRPEAHAGSRRTPATRPRPCDAPTGGAGPGDCGRLPVGEFAEILQAS